MTHISAHQMGGSNAESGKSRAPAITLPDHSAVHDVKCGCPHEGVWSNADTCGQGVGMKNGSFFRTSFVDDPKSNINVKYADDAYLLIGSQNINTAAEEFSNITTWDAKNNLRLNHTKTK